MLLACVDAAAGPEREPRRELRPRPASSDIDPRRDIEPSTASGSSSGLQLPEASVTLPPSRLLMAPIGRQRLLSRRSSGRRTPRRGACFLGVGRRSTRPTSGRTPSKPRPRATVARRRRPWRRAQPRALRERLDRAPERELLGLHRGEGAAQNSRTRNSETETRDLELRLEAHLHRGAILLAEQDGVEGVLLRLRVPRVEDGGEVDVVLGALWRRRHIG